jgi:4-carboxymuconolactone decarboxylase
MYRLPDLEPERMSPEQRDAYQSILSGPRGVVQGPLLAWLQSPGLAHRAQELGAYCRYGTALSPRLSELAILVTGSFWRAGFEWHVHAPIGVAAGLDPEAVEALRIGTSPRLEREDEQAVFRFSNELLQTRAISDVTYQAAEMALGTHALVDLVGVLGYYGLISMTIKAFRVPVPSGAPEPFKDLD